MWVDWGRHGSTEALVGQMAMGITNAIARAYGVRVLRLPVDQDRLLRAKLAGQEEVNT